jgi:Rrf2 family protein
LLQITKRVDYALVALSHLAHHPGSRFSARCLADAYQLSGTLMANVLKRLGKDGLVSSSRGTKGGYELSESPSRIPVGRVVELLEGPLKLAECVHPENSDDPHDCVASPNCPVRRGVFQIHLKIRDLLYGQSIADLAGLAHDSTRLPVAGSVPLEGDRP